MSNTLSGFAGRSAMATEERHFVLKYLPQLGHVLEIGTLDGATVAYWATKRPGCRFLSVDPFRAAHGTGPGNVVHWLKNKRPNMNLFLGTLQEFSYYEPKTKFSTIFVDGDHSYEGAALDIRLASALLSPGGRLLVHDYGREVPLLKGVTKAVDEVKALLGKTQIDLFRCIAVLE